MIGNIDLDFEIQPYPGLRPFREDETHLYFGREEHRGELLKRLAASRFVAVVGTSGSGKSSLVRAGLLPDLLSGYLAGAGSDWVIVETRPGADPLGQLAAALTAAGWATDAVALRTNSAHLLDLAEGHLAPGQQLLVLVDQFEELFRLKTSEDPAEDADEKAAFVRLLLNAGGQRADVTAQNPRVHVVMAMRSEFLGRASVYRGLPEAIDQGQYLIPRLSREQLRKAIEAPARVASGEVEEALVQRLLNELGDDQDQLPVLQHALMRCWQLRDREGAIGLDAYEKSGQLADALSMDANEALAETRQAMDLRGEHIVKRAFQALRETDVNGGQTRRPTTVDGICELAECSAEELTVALAPFRQRSFVVPPPDTTLQSSTLLDISHEALLRRWDALRRWIDEDNLDRARYVRLATRAAEEQDSESPQYLVPPQLDLLVKFWADRNPSKAWALRHHKGYERAKAFLDESEGHRRALEQDEAHRRAEDGRQKQALAEALAKRRRWKRRAIVGSIAAAAILTVGTVVLRNALVQGTRLEALLLGAKLANIPEANVEARLQVAAEAARRLPNHESMQELLKILFVAPTPKQAGWGGELVHGAVSVAISPDDARLYAVADGRLRMIELASGREAASRSLAEYPGAGEDPFLLASSTKLVMMGDSQVAVVDGRTLQVLAQPPIADVTAFTVSADGGQAAFLASGVVTLCDLTRDCASPVPHDVKHLSPTDLELSADGQLLVIIGTRTGERRPIALFATNPWKERKVRLINAAESLNLAVDAQHVHLCTRDSIQQYDAYDDTLDERTVRRFATKAERCRLFGGRAVASHADGLISVSDENGTVVTQAKASASVNSAKSLALGSTTLVAATADKQVQAWDIGSYGRRNQSGRLLGFGRSHAYGYRDGELIELESGKVTAGPGLTFEKGLPVAVSDSLELAAYYPIGDTRELVLAKLHPGRSPLECWRIAPPKEVRRVVISPDDSRVAIEMADGNTMLLDAGDKTTIELKEKSMMVFSPSNALLTSDDLKVADVSANEGEEDGKFELAGRDAAVFSPDGRLLALAGQRGRQNVVGLFEWPAKTPVGPEFKHLASVTSLSFRSDGSALMTSTADGTTHVWDLGTWKESLRIPPPGRNDTTAAFTANGLVAIFQGSDDRRAGDTGLWVLPTSSDEFVNEACRRIARNLTDNEWTQFVGSEVGRRMPCPDRP